MSVQITGRSLEYYVTPISEGVPYSFARYGDGEWGSALGKKGQEKWNCDGHRYFRGMRDDFRAVFRDLRDTPEQFNYWIGIQKLAMNMWGPRIQTFLANHDLLKRDWHDADVFHRASRLGQLKPLVVALKQANTVVVGPRHLRALEEIFGYNEFVQIPPHNCYRQMPWIIQHTDKAIRRVPKPVVVCISASMPAEIIIHRLYPEHRGHAFLIDFGSVFDPYVGVVSRKYHRGMKSNVIHAISPVRRVAVASGSAARPATRKKVIRRRA